MPIPLGLKWLLFFVSNGILGAGFMMLTKGSFPPPMSRVKVGPILATSVFVVGMTGLLVFGEPEMLQTTLNVLTGK